MSSSKKGLAEESSPSPLGEPDLEVTDLDIADEDGTSPTSQEEWLAEESIPSPLAELDLGVTGLEIEDEDETSPAPQKEWLADLSISELVVDKDLGKFQITNSKCISSYSWMPYEYRMIVPGKRLVSHNDETMLVIG
jgi:hypothetical protein